MLIFENHNWQMQGAFPDTDYTEGTASNHPKWVVDDNSELAEKIRQTSAWEPVEDENGRLTDIIPLESEESVKAQLSAIDSATVRPIRAILAGAATDEDRARLAVLEQQAATLRARLKEVK